MEAAVSQPSEVRYPIVARPVLTPPSTEEDPDDYPFPLTLRGKQTGEDEAAPAPVNGN